MLILSAVMLFHLAIASVYDIGNRCLPRFLMITGGLIAIAGIIISSINGYALFCGIAVIVYLAITGLNAYWIKRNGHVLIGGADNLVLLEIATVTPVIGILPTLIVIPAGAFIISTLVRMIPKVNQDFTERKIPYIPFMLAVWVSMMLIRCLI